MSLACRLHYRRAGFTLDLAFQTRCRVLALTGPSGAGKSTTLQALAGLVTPTYLSLAVNGSPVIDTARGLNPPAHKRGMGYVFQDVRLFPHLTVAGNLAYARRLARQPIPLSPIIDMLDLESLLERQTSALSGGEARRVAIARALCSQPQMMLLDEPFGGLDTGRREALIPYLLKLRDISRLPMILVSHDPRDLAAIAEDAVSIRAGRVDDDEARSAQTGPVLE